MGNYGEGGWENQGEGSGGTGGGTTWSLHMNIKSENPTRS